LHVAIVDDDRATRFLMEQGLQRHGWRTTAFASPQEAEQAVRAAPRAFDAVVTDHAMPGATGIDLAQALRAIRADLAVILVSGHVNDELRALAADAGIAQVLQKRLSVRELCDAIHGMLQGTRRRNSGSGRSTED
jgi:DNA-binding response OmpR family regulator